MPDDDRDVASLEARVEDLHGSVEELETVLVREEARGEEFWEVEVHLYRTRDAEGRTVYAFLQPDGGPEDKRVFVFAQSADVPDPEAAVRVAIAEQVNGDED